MKLIQLLVGFALSLFGCLSAAPESVASDVPVSPHVPQFSEDKGALLVRVVTEELEPVSGATVATTDGRLNGTTNLLGEAAFDDILPGQYTIFVHQIGYEAEGRTVLVSVGEATILKVVLTAVAIVTPYSETLQKTAVWRCYIQVGPARDTTCGLAQSRLNNDSAFFIYTVGEGWNGTVTEATTQPSTALGAKGFWFSMWDKGQRNCYFYLARFSPVRHLLEPGPNPNPPCGGSPTSTVPEGPTLFTGTFSAWNGDQTTDLSVTWEQRYHVYLSLFYHAPPPENYSALGDA